MLCKMVGFSSFLWLNNILCTLFWLWPSIRNTFYISTQNIYAHAHRHTHTPTPLKQNISWNITIILCNSFWYFQFYIFLFKYWSLIFRPIIGLQNALKDIKKRLDYYSLLCLHFHLNIHTGGDLKFAMFTRPEISRTGNTLAGCGGRGARRIGRSHVWVSFPFSVNISWYQYFSETINAFSLSRFRYRLNFKQD